jgi:hypothetical protein
MVMHEAERRSVNMRYFVAGNIWLFVALAIFLLRVTERTGPHRVSLLGVGTWFTPAGYNAVVGLVLLVACLFLIASWRKKKEG